ncbi:glycosyltransferase family 2 protein [Alysiella crassa]|uniref:PGL/p-HBAD biosynthesis glycosyltransferase Rv2957/MT3031 n=1 Tax=Alysiella crassa TaxID=153491 RepID=A0A376BUX4_9NEIS|nr:glycosyltransferase family 2 protein [Alysiella crassa]UOP06235.1 glycosyltransferase family 2 protein [Alysiella crassa]SSY80719.1 PGL/p-HBAD biosynthesis glycosyltransferase Rv2957/MT3031 [Alysiella crassa]
MNTNPLLTVALITKNEAHQLAACLDSIAPLHCEIIVIDSGSTDNTLKIAQQYGANCHIFSDWQGFGVQRNRAHEFIHTPWVLWLDADERLSEQTCQDILFRLPETPADGRTVFSINRLTIAYGHAIRHCGWYPDRVVRLYPVAHCAYNFDLVHESVQTQPETKIIPLADHVYHETYTDLNQHLNKLMHYTSAWAQQYQGKRQASPISACWKACFSFLRIYVLKKGVLDGKAGLIIAVMGAIYTFVKYTQLWLLNQKSERM